MSFQWMADLLSGPPFRPVVVTAEAIVTTWDNVDVIGQRFRKTTEALSGAVELLRSFAKENDASRSVLDQQLVVIGFGSFRRLSGHSSDAQSLMSGSPEIARLVSLFREDASLIESVAWLREVYLRRLEKDDKDSPELRLEETVLALLDDGLLPDGAKVVSFDSSGLKIRQNGIDLLLQELSDGYKTVAALVLSIVHHLNRAYGDLDVERREGHGPRVLIKNPAVVLIDEVELHLHVSWQKRIGFWLKQHFPAIQFLVTTHSPFVCQAADPGGLIRLPAPGENRKVEKVSDEVYNAVVNGSIDEAVLSDLFGIDSLYSEETESLRSRVANLEAKVIAGKAEKTEKEELKQLRSKLPRSMSSAVDIATRSVK